MPDQNHSTDAELNQPSEKLTQSVHVVLDSLRREAQHRPEVRLALNNIAIWLDGLVAGAGGPASAAHTDAAAPSPASGAYSDANAAAPSDGGRVIKPTSPVDLNIGGAQARVNVFGTTRDVRAAQAAAAPPRFERPSRIDDGDDDSADFQRPGRDPIDVVCQRARIKAQATRWAAQRRRLMEEGADFKETIDPKDKEFGERARQLETRVNLWMLDAFAKLPGEEHLIELAECYENLALAAELARDLEAVADTEDVPLNEGFNVLAEAQSALRYAVLEYAAKNSDEDQSSVFFWLQRQTKQRSIYIPRHMRVDDPADPADWADTRQRIEALRGQWERSRDKDRNRREYLNKARYHAKNLAESPQAPETSEEFIHDWRTLLHAVADLIDDGVPPSNVDIRNLLLPIFEAMPSYDELTADGQTLPSQAMLALREVENYLAAREAESNAVDEKPRQPSKEVQEAAKLLAGKTAVLVGGDIRPQAKAALERDLGLAELRWIATDPHESLSKFEPEVRRPDTDVILLAIRWASHSYEGINDLCREYDKPFVRLPRGYSPNQVALEFMQQASKHPRFNGSNDDE